MNKSKKIILTISIIIYIISLTQEGFCTTAGQCAKGFLDVLVGWMGVLILHLPAMVWLANPILILSWVVNKRHKKASFIFSVVSLIIMLSFLLFDEIMVNESGALSRITSYGLGYWLWVSSAFIMVIGNAFLFYKKKKEGQIYSSNG